MGGNRVQRDVLGRRRRMQHHCVSGMVSLYKNSPGFFLIKKRKIVKVGGISGRKFRSNELYTSLLATGFIVSAILYC